MNNLFFTQISSKRGRKMGILKKIFKSYSTKELKRIEPLKEKVLALEEDFKKLSDNELKNMTNILKEKLANGATLDDILPEAFATCIEASWRVLEMRHFPVQVVGGIVLHQGRIAEMKTGEGKTLVATLPSLVTGCILLPLTIILQNVTLNRWAKFTDFWGFQSVW